MTVASTTETTETMPNQGLLRKLVNWSRYLSGYSVYRLRRVPTIVILGMHRSGTSFVASAFSHAGVHFGDDLLERDEWNKAGYFEARFAVAINEWTLEGEGATWDNPPAGPVSMPFGAKKMLIEFLSEGWNQSHSGIKDPRLVLTLNEWKPFLSNPAYLYCFRSPQAVAKSLARREGFTIERGLELWADYNERLLDIAARHTRRSCWFNFDEITQSAGESLRLFGEQIGIPALDVAVHERYSPKLKTHAHRPIENPRVRNIYDRLVAAWQSSLK